MSIRYVKLLFLIISFASFGAWADLSFKTIPTTKHPSPSSYTVEQLSQEIKMPASEEIEHLQPPKPQKRRTIDIITENFRKFIQKILTVFKKVGDYFLAFLENNNAREKSSEITKNLTPSYVSLLQAEQLIKEDYVEEPVRNFDEVKATHFEENDPLFAEKERIKKELEKIKRMRQAEKAFIEITDETEETENDK